MALGTLLTRRRQEPERAEPAAELLAKEYRAAEEEPAVHDLLEVVIGTSTITHRFHQLRTAAKDEVRRLLTGAPAAVTGGRNEPAAGDGVRHRTVVERSALDLPDGPAELTAALGRDAEVRVVDHVPTRLVIADRALALVPLTSHSAEPAALVVHASGLLDLLSGCSNPSGGTSCRCASARTARWSGARTAPTAPTWRS